MEATSADAAPRSYLYVPGDRASLLAKACDRGADALILDLEDSVHPNNKELARRTVTTWLDGLDGQVLPSLWLRVNSDAFGSDLAVVRSSITGVMLPAAEVASLERLVSRMEMSQPEIASPSSELGVIALIETARGLLDVGELAAHPSVRHLAIGRADLAGDLGLAVDPDGPEFRSLMLPLVVASAAAHISPPIGPTSTDFRDLAKLRETTAALAALGFRGRTAIHPAQVAVINEVFTPGAREIERAERTLAVFQAALDQGSGVAVDDDGTMIDAAVVRRARAVLAQAGR